VILIETGTRHMTSQDKRIEEVEPVNGGTLMVHLARGYCLNDEGCHTFGADDRREVRSTMRAVKACGCSECATAGRRTSINSVKALTKRFAYLDALRDSGITNMFGASPYLENAFHLKRDAANDILKKWMKTFDGKSTPAERAFAALTSGETAKSESVS
jgi:DNA-binding LacI/PurR family transcriptional regulator